MQTVHQLSHTLLRIIAVRRTLRAAKPGCALPQRRGCCSLLLSELQRCSCLLLMSGALGCSELVRSPRCGGTRGLVVLFSTDRLCCSLQGLAAPAELPSRIVAGIQLIAPIAQQQPIVLQDDS